MCCSIGRIAGGAIIGDTDATVMQEKRSQADTHLTSFTGVDTVVEATGLVTTDTAKDGRSVKFCRTRSRASGSLSVAARRAALETQGTRTVELQVQGTGRQTRTAAAAVETTATATTAAPATATPPAAASAAGEAG